ncbi:hypothetical protein [Mucilaginibacter sp.]|uniref:hypothetical protein n=1 Tax=Mucilaginibacter sp. TaxID=1882438 RepID=UPI0028506629|nr:hypothetical protein [Mucilaginibacter sp.]MDR3693817.1 hypothetical protein [Mucilaginibacter sp.]
MNLTSTAPVYNAVRAFLDTIEDIKVNICLFVYIDEKKMPLTGTMRQYVKRIKKIGLFIANN